MVEVNTATKNATGKTTTTRQKPSTKKAKEKPREIVYPNRTVELHLAASEHGPITVEKMKKWLGWMDEEDHKAEWKKASPNADEASYKFPGNHLLVDLQGRKVICKNNSRNRPYNNGLALEYMQEMLNKNWADSRNGAPGELTDNGDTFVIGRTGEMISGQHRGIGFILAWQALQGMGVYKDKLSHYKAIWGDTPITIEGTVQFGVSEHPKVLRTVDQTRTRTFADVLFTDPTYTGDLKVGDRVPFARCVDMAIKFLWSRTGEKKDAYAPRRTNSEAGAWLDNHPTLKAIASSLITLNKTPDGKPTKLTGLMGLGDIAGVWYLMATSNSDGDLYRNMDERNEKKKGIVNFDHKNHADEFWKKFADDDSFAPVRQAFKNLSDEDKGATGGGHKSEKLCILCHVWKKFLAGEPFVGEDLIPVKKFSTEKKMMVLDEWPSFGGIDLGPEKPKEKKEEKKDTTLEGAENATEGEEDEVPFEEGDEPSQEELDAIAHDEEAVQDAHANKAKAVEEHNASVLKEEKPEPMTPANAFDGWDAEPTVDPEPRKGRKRSK